VLPALLSFFPRSVDRLFQLSDPDRENLCLYGHSDGSWEVDLPAEEVPPEVPEPALGINFARDGMQASNPPCPTPRPTIA
jgi:Alfin